MTKASERQVAFMDVQQYISKALKFVHCSANGLMERKTYKMILEYARITINQMILKHPFNYCFF